MNGAARTGLGVGDGDPAGRSYVEVLGACTEGLVETQLGRALGGDASHVRFAHQLHGPDEGTALVKEVAMPLFEREVVVGLLVLSVELELPAPASLPGRLPRLTPRQREVLRLMSIGFAAKRIAAELGVSYQTARNHVRSVEEALGARSHVEAVVTATRLGLVDDAIV
jgi:DNA-binding CsgD family transcriptional regulator